MDRSVTHSVIHNNLDLDYFWPLYGQILEYFIFINQVNSLIEISSFFFFSRAKAWSGIFGRGNGVLKNVKAGASFNFSVRDTLWVKMPPRLKQHSTSSPGLNTRFLLIRTSSPAQSGSARLMNMHAVPLLLEVV